jgi:CheY-like chemotaxis protein/HPt (histidine-containing phosphotransfer) domain-containing protein
LPLLVVEDNPVNQQVVAGWLKRFGYRADVAANGFEALEALRRIPYAAVLMDCQMPELDGYQATAEIRRREGARRHTPIVAVTANAMNGDRERCLAAGMDEYIAKPIRIEELEAVLRRVLPTSASSTPSSPPTDETPSKLPELGAAIDRGVLARLERLNRPGKDSELARLIGYFIEDTPPRLAAMSRAVAAHDGPSLKEVAHALKGAAGHFGAQEMVSLCVELERSAQTGNLDEAAVVLEQLADAYARASHELERVREAA